MHVIHGGQNLDYLLMSNWRQGARWVVDKTASKFNTFSITVIIYY